MAMIDIGHDDLQPLVGQELSIDRLESEGSMLGILFEDAEKEDVIQVEVEPNRPDLLSAEGVARALRGFFGIETGAVDYPVEDGDVTVNVEEAVDGVRPYIACAVIRDMEMDDAVRNSLIQLQEKLTETYGRKRAKIAIGLHDLKNVEPPFTYTAVAADDHAFTPLGMDAELPPGEVLEQHEKGREYGWILDDADRYPLIVDDTDAVLSMPPIINGAATEVTEETTDIFLDVTGTSQQEVATALHILVAAFHERGGTIEAVQVDGERMPDMEGEVMDVDPDYVRKISGLDDLSVQGMQDCLETMRYQTYDEDGGLQVEVPAYRADVMHPYDIIEDVVIGYGYDDVNPELPAISTVGGKTDERVFIDHLRELMVGAGAQETMTFILSNHEKLFDNMERAEDDVVSMANPLTEDYTVVRHELLPALLDVLGGNQHNRFPQQLFEVGRCAVLDEETDTGARDRYQLAYVHADSDASFADARGVLQSVVKAMDGELAVEQAEHPSFAEQRCGTVQVDGEECGVIGAVSERVRANWGIEEPVVAFELDVDRLRQLSAE